MDVKKANRMKERKRKQEKANRTESKQRLNKANGSQKMFKRMLNGKL